MPNQNDPTHFLEGNFKYKVFSLTKYSISVRGSKTWNEPLLIMTIWQKDLNELAPLVFCNFLLNMA